MKKLLLSGAMLMALSFGAQAQEQILTSFEADEQGLLYTAGTDIGEYDALWGTYNTTTDGDIDAGAAVISADWATDGDQSLYFPAQMVGTANGTNINFALTSVLNFTNAGLVAPYSVGFDAATGGIDTDLGSNFYADFYSYSSTAGSTVIGSFVFNFDGTLLAANYETSEYEEIGTFDTESATYKFRVDSEDTITIVVNGDDVLTYTLDSADITGAYFVAFGADDWGTDYSVDRITVAQEVASVKNNTLAGVSVYPNPSNSVVNVATDKAQISDVKIVDINGRTVKNASFAGVSNAQVNISDLANGVYVMTINSDKGSVTKKVVKN